jgi:uncharacterized membrane protein
MNAQPKTVPEYLEQLRLALGNADPALVQDALFDAEDYLRSALAERQGRTEAETIAEIATSYGAPEEVAAIYLDQEATVIKALQPPRPAARKGALAQFFGVLFEARTYGALFYMLLSLATGIFYFTWAVTGVSLGAGLSVLIVGIPFIVLFMGTVYALSLVEGRIVEVLLGVRMPRRPLQTQREGGFFSAVVDILKNPRTWGTLLYMVLMLPLGIVYFTIAITGLSLAGSLVAAPFASLAGWPLTFTWGYRAWEPAGWELVPLVAIGALLLMVLLYVARGVGYLHGQLAKLLLVKAGGNG